uniref:telomere repeats-binding bouquet formation protein 1-like isoform X1 n=3 Tax=Oncorhynchus gorbuscha TaxID=8017 RepID=UPI001EAF305E|nr:telomere repeats-binding bouquet formation protein 1-like isoform X1 [Oncorhynchus gorbuscha]
MLGPKTRTPYGWYGVIANQIGGTQRSHLTLPHRHTPLTFSGSALTLNPMKMEMYVSSISKRNATKTDLSLLLECLKYQMKCPASQKQALFTIYSICQQREENVDFFREMGGVVFVYNLSKSSVHSEVRETAQFTLGMLAEANVYCKQALCRRETFSDLAECLMQQDSPLTQRRVAVYLLSVLVANNRSGQKFAQTSGCLDILLDLFRTSFPLSGEATVRPANVTQLFQLWTSVSSALCGCVNNPQNEESQRMCVSAFPLVKGWLQQLSHPYAEMVQPICSFISMTVANNHFAQDSFSTVGGLGNLTLTLIRLASDASHSPLACQLSVIMTKTLSACIIDNPVLASGLAGYGLVAQLHSLLSSPSLEPQDRLIVILTLGHCTEASEEHRSQFLQCGGLSLITLLTESTSEELRKAAAFILQTCKQATVFLRGAVHGESQGQTAELEPPVDMEGYWRSARDMLHRINQLERQQAQGGDRQPISVWRAVHYACRPIISSW